MVQAAYPLPLACPPAHHLPCPFRLTGNEEEAEARPDRGSGSSSSGSGGGRAAPSASASASASAAGSGDAGASGGTLVPTSHEGRYREVLAVPLPRRPLYPGGLMPVNVSNNKLIKELVELRRQG